MLRSSPDVGNAEEEYFEDKSDAGDGDDDGRDFDGEDDGHGSSGGVFWA